MTPNLNTSPIQWQSLKRTFRSALLLAAVYFAGVVTTVFQLPLWLWLTVEGVMRYAPFWLSVPIFLYLGWQLDTIVNLPLGLGLVLLCALQLLLYFVRAPRTPLIQVTLRVGGFFIFALITSQWWGVNWSWIVIQTFLYSVALILNFYRRQRL